MKKPKYKERYVLAIGQPLVFERCVELLNDKGWVKMKRPAELVDSVISMLPRYRLVLERVKGKR